MKKTYILAIIIALVIGIWMVSGLFQHDNNTPEKQGLDSTNGEMIRVRTRQIKAEPQRIEITLRGKTEAKRIVDIKAETGGRVVDVPVEKGQRIAKGATLCRLAEDDHLALLKQAQAAYEKASIDYEGALKLQDKNLLSTTAIAASKAAKENASANLKTAEIAVERLTMKAPFDGFVEDRPAQIGDLIERSGICARLIDESTILAVAQASEREVTSLQIGQPVSVQLTDGGQLSGTISFVGRTADPQTRTYRIEATLESHGRIVRDGSTTQLTIPLNEVMAHKISPAVLALDDNGQIGVRVVNNGNFVEFHPVKVIRENADGVWVSGLPESVNLITVGQEFVADGDKVNPTQENNGAQHAKSEIPDKK